MAVTIQQAACNALQTFLAAQLTGVTVWARWPDANTKLPAKAVTILVAGDRREEIYDPIVISKTNIDSHTASYVWEVATIRQPIQLDIWATSDISRDDITAKLDQFLHYGPSFTLGGNLDPVSQSVLLALGDGWSGNADFQFNSATYHNSSDSVQRTEYRATMMGTCTAALNVTATSARLARIIYQQRVADQPYVPTDYTYQSINIPKT